MRNTILYILLLLCAAQAPAETPVKRVLYIGDSMTGWLAERLNAYGAENGFTVSTIVWDGSTIRKWGQSGKLKSIIRGYDPDVVFISLGLNELLEKNPEKRFKKAVTNILSAVGNRGLVWVGPPSWPGKGSGETLVDWLRTTLGEERFFDSSGLRLERQSKTNPHPTRGAVMTWTDSVVEWLASRPELGLDELQRPARNKMVRGNNFRYIRMKGTI